MSPLTEFLIVQLQARLPLRRNERGLSQSTENAILLAGAVVIAGIIIQVITAFVRRELPK